MTHGRPENMTKDVMDELEKQEPLMVATEDQNVIAELRALIREQQEVAVKQNESIKALNDRLDASERRQYAAPAQAPVQEQPKIDPQKAAYISMLKEMGVKPEDFE